ncbi:MAG TPA: TonB family protein, partial [Rhizobiaceae bacterium]
MARGLEPAFTPGRPVWPLAGMALAGFEPDDPDLPIPHGALQNGIRETPERLFAANHNGLITHRPAEPLAPKPAKSLDLKRKWTLALLASCVFHAAVALFLIQATDGAVLEEGADFYGIALLGSPEDMVAAGAASETEDTIDVTMVTMLDAVPVRTVDAQPVPVDDAVEATDVAEIVKAETKTLKPVEETLAERVTEATAEPVQPERVKPEAVDSAPAPAVTETVPEVLATDWAELVDDDNFVPKVAETQSAEPGETADTTRVAPAPPAEAATQVARTEPATKAEKQPAEEKTPAAERKVAKPKAEDGKKVAEKAKPKKSGSGGRSEANAQRGQADGQEKGDSRQASRGGSNNSQVGNAAVANYPGKVRSKLARVARSVRAKARGEVVVAFAVGSNGGVRAARVARSSGVASVDEAALQAIQKASPFPPIPPSAGRST